MTWLYLDNSHQRIYALQTGLYSGFDDFHNIRCIDSSPLLQAGLYSGFDDFHNIRCIDSSPLLQMGLYSGFDDFHYIRCIDSSSLLQTGLYSGFDDFHADMVLVKENCYLYNPEQSAVRRDCDDVFNFYIQEFNKLTEKWQKVCMHWFCFSRQNLGWTLATFLNSLKYTVKSFLFVGHLISSWLGQYTHLRSQQNIYLYQ